MSSALITGIQGFVGSYLCQHLHQSGHEVFGVIKPQSPANPAVPIDKNVRIFSTDLSAADQITHLFKVVKFDYIFHLAGMAFVPDAWNDPSGVLHNNTLATVNLLQAAKKADWRGRFLFISSGEIYGAPPASEMPISEKLPPSPQGPYAASKLAAEYFAGYFNSEDIKVIIARPFNHIGPGQRTDFVVPSFLLRIQKALRENKKSIRVGDLDAGRDFTDVRDVVRAYLLLLQKGIAGEIYNVCTGKNTPIRDVLEIAMRSADVQLAYDVDQSLLRQEGSLSRYGSSEKLRGLGWSPVHSLEQSIADIWRDLHSGF